LPCKNFADPLFIHTCQVHDGVKSGQEALHVRHQYIFNMTRAKTDEAMKLYWTEARKRLGALKQGIKHKRRFQLSDSNLLQN